VSANHYFSLAFKGFIKLAENNSDPDAMSVLSDMFALGIGTVPNMEKATYWLDRCYLIRTGMTFQQWEQKNT
jgi:TPR repeat protein